LTESERQKLCSIIDGLVMLYNKNRALLSGYARIRPRAASGVKLGGMAFCVKTDAPDGRGKEVVKNLFL